MTKIQNWLFYPKITVVCLYIGGLCTVGAQQAPTSPVSEVLSYAVMDRGAHYQMWSRVLSQTNAEGQVVYQTNSCIERASGLNYWDGQQWSASNPSFQLSQDRNVASANQIQNKVSLAANLNTNGAVTVTTADGLTLHSTPIAIALYDSASGSFATIASITNCTGFLLSTNKIVYSNAFVGLCVDVIYTVDRGSFQQDVVINGHLDPLDFGFPSNTTRIQILTEFYQPPQPDQVGQAIRLETNQSARINMASPDFMDSTLGFGELVVGAGRAHTAATPDPIFGGVPVGKQFLAITNQGTVRTFLIESVEYPSIRKELDALPECDGQLAAIGGKREIQKTLVQNAAIPIPHPGAKSVALFGLAPAKIAALGNPGGVMIDYLAMSGTSNQAVTFQGDTTYFISGPLFCNGAAVFEGGTVIKYPSTNTTAYIQLNSSVTFGGSSYLPIVFTSADDNSVGEALTTNAWAGYTGTVSGYYANPALLFHLDYSGTVNNMRFNNALQAIRLDFENLGTETVTFAHSQFVNCSKGVEVGPAPSALNLYNDLFSGVQFPLNSDQDYFHTNPYTLYNCTVDAMTSFDYGIYISGGTNYTFSFYSTNSIFANTSDTNGSYSVGGTSNGFYNFAFRGGSTFGTGPISASSSPFQTVGAGNYYLTDSSLFRNAGTTNINATLLSQLRQKTTYPPMVCSNVTLTSDTTLFSQAQRDVDSPDLGFHYDPIDYIADSFGITNAFLTVTNGTVVACFNDAPGIWLQGGGGIVSIGTPLSPNWFTHYSSVQEQSLDIGTGGTAILCVNPYHPGAASPSGTFKFSNFSCSGVAAFQLYDSTSWTYTNLFVQNCQFWNGKSQFDTGSGDSLTLDNNLFVRSGVFAVGTFLTNTTLGFSNNLVWNTTLQLTAPLNGLGWSAYNNAVDSCGGNNLRMTNNANNGYLNSVARIAPTNGTEVISTNTMSYLTGTLGKFYQPTNSIFINAGNTNADLVGLYHYTTQTNQVKETNSIVDIGFHYVAVTNGLPFDSDGDGVPDYVEDANGNGSVDSGETNWQDKRDFGLKILITRPKGNSIIP